MKLRVLPSGRRRSKEDTPPPYSTTNLHSVYSRSDIRTVSLSRIRAEFQKKLSLMRSSIDTSLESSGNIAATLNVESKGPTDAVLPNVDSPVVSKIKIPSTPSNGRNLNISSIVVSPPTPKESDKIANANDDDSESSEAQIPVGIPKDVRTSSILDTPKHTEARKHKRRSSSVGDAATVQAKLRHQQIQELLRQHAKPPRTMPKDNTCGDSMVRRETRGHLLRAENTDQWRSQSIDDMYEELSEELVRQTRMHGEEAEPAGKTADMPELIRDDLDDAIPEQVGSPAPMVRSATHGHLFRRDNAKDFRRQSVEMMHEEMQLQIERLSQDLLRMRESYRTGKHSEYGTDVQSTLSRQERESMISLDWNGPILDSRQSSMRKVDGGASDAESMDPEWVANSLNPSSLATDVDPFSPGADSVFMVENSSLSWLNTQDAIPSIPSTRTPNNSIAVDANSPDDLQRREKRGNLLTMNKIGLFREESIRQEEVAMKQEVERLLKGTDIQEREDRLKGRSLPSIPERPTFRKYQDSPELPPTNILMNIDKVVDNFDGAMPMTSLDIAHIYIEELMKKVVELEIKLNRLTNEKENESALQDSGIGKRIPARLSEVNHSTDTVPVFYDFDEEFLKAAECKAKEFIDCHVMESVASPPPRASERVT